MSFLAAIECHGLTRQFGELLAVDRLDLTVPKQSIYGFLGPNGSGKSTTMRMLCGLLLPTSGEVEVLGMKLPQASEKLKQHIGYMTQKFSLYDDLTIQENLRFMAQAYALPAKTQKSRLEETLAVYKLDKLRHQLAGTLSGGQKQRLALAAATLHKPQLLFLDEPTSGVDPQSRRDFWESLFNLIDDGVTVLLSTHYMDEAERCHQLAILDHGYKADQGVPAEMIAHLDAWVVKIDNGSIPSLKQQLAQAKEIISLSQMGGQLRLLVNKTVTDPLAYVQQQIAGLAIDLAKHTISLTEPTLEDVFVVATQKPHNHSGGEFARGTT